MTSLAQTCSQAKLQVARFIRGIRCRCHARSFVRTPSNNKGKRSDGPRNTFVPVRRLQCAQVKFNTVSTKVAESGFCLQPTQLGSGYRRGAQDEDLSKTARCLLLAWFAGRDGSVFAAQCLVEQVLCSYLKNYSIDDLKIGLSSTKPLDEDLLTSWVAVVSLTLEEIGLQQVWSEQVPTASFQAKSPDALGVLGYVKNTIGLYDSGYTLDRLQDLQGAANQDPAIRSEGSSQFLALMQQYSRLVLMTVEVVASLQLPTTKELQSNTFVPTPSGFVPELCALPSQGGAAGQAGHGVLPERALAVHLLIAFMGSVLGSAFSTQAFASGVLGSYRAGWTAAEVVAALQPSDLQRSGMLVRAAPLSGQPGHTVTAQLFARWLSVVYMTYAELGVPYPAAREKVGWAWGEDGEPAEAVALAEFVANTLVRLAPDSMKRSSLQEKLEAQREQSPEQVAHLMDTMYDPGPTTFMVTEEGQLLLGGEEAPLLVKVEDEQLAATSSAIALMRQQVDLVAAAYTTAQQLAASPIDMNNT